MVSLGHVARRTGRIAALSVVALIFLASSGVLLTLALYFVMAPIYGVPQTLLILGLIHLGTSLLLGGVALLDRRRSGRDDARDPASAVRANPVSALTEAFFTGLNQGVAAGSQGRARPR